MKLQITFKDPDGPSECLHDTVTGEIAKLPDLDSDERNLLVEKRTMELREKLKPWIEYGEYVSIEFDTDAGTATVCRCKAGA